MNDKAMIRGKAKLTSAHVPKTASSEQEDTAGSRAASQEQQQMGDLVLQRASVSQMTFFQGFVPEQSRMKQIIR